VPFYIEYYGQNFLLQGKIVCNERLDGRFKGCFQARMNFLIVLGTLILKIPLGILKNVEFYGGFLPIFCGSGRYIDRNRIALFRHKSWIGLTLKTLARAKVRAKHLRLTYAWPSAGLRSTSQVLYLPL
jgi:hypothetical protein